MNIMKEKASHLSRELKKDWSISISHDSGAVPVAVGRSWADVKWKTAHHESFERHRLVRWRVRLGSMAIFILKDNTQTIIDSTRSCDLSLSNTFVDTRGAMTVNGNLSFGQDTVVFLGTGGGWDSGVWARKRRLERWGSAHLPSRPQDLHSTTRVRRMLMLTTAATAQSPAAANQATV